MIYNHRSYSTLLLPEIETLDLQTAKSLKEFVQNGGRIVFIEKRPFKSPTYENGDKNDEAVKQTIEELLKTDKVILYPAPEDDVIEWYGRLQDELGLRPYVKFSGTNKFLSQSSYQIGENTLFFIANTSLSEHISVVAEFDVPDRFYPWIWDPETGDRSLYPTSGSNNKIRLELPHATSVLIVFEPENKGESYQMAVPKKLGVELAGAWQLQLNHLNGETKGIGLDVLVDLTERDDTKEFAGEVIYEKTIDVGSEHYQYLDLGEVKGVSELTLNGKQVGTKWYGAHVYDVSDVLNPGENLLQIKITTIVGNYLKGLKDNPVAMTWTRRQPYYSMGILGPVELK
jgi:hypothetical protein